ncbi:MAG: bis(5'-nucleosyl)-tetraphosphatase (symmetrical) [Betaproteobacteria bacterium RIFCSPLOWO2_02_FULL_63_19]|nr:MAG: bis(5'-nucleosyl)-tetraphosphatase (symmetrical) [Betaproteobacteria bacterium RIFCSPLOWO2_02_FULL_63_19]
MATYAIGDVQGCYVELRALLEEIRYDERCDRLWFVGDLVNRGPDSLRTLRFVKRLGDRAVTVLGNHDLHLIALACGHGRIRDDDTLNNVLEAPDCGELIDWMRTLPLLHVADRHVMVHAGLLPQWSIAKAQLLAREVEDRLRGPRYREFLDSMYGSKPDQWQDDLHGVDRLRVIVNAMTRMRFCSVDGRMDFKTKGESTRAPAGCVPWFEVPARASQSATIICGHWSALGLKLLPNLIALDAGCVWGGKLTAIRLEDRTIAQVDSATGSDRLG